MNRGEVKLKLVFDDDVFLEANYFVLFKSLDDREELKDTITGLLCKLIEGKEEIFEGAVVEVDMQDSDEIYVCAYGPLSEEIIEWIRKEEYETLH